MSGLCTIGFIGSRAVKNDDYLKQDDTNRDFALNTKC